MAIPASNPCVLYRDFGYREPQSNPSSAAASAAASSGGGSVVTSGYSLARRGVCLKRRGDLRAGAFWISKQSSVEMEEIAGMEEMDEVLRRSKELSEPVVIDW